MRAAYTHPTVSAIYDEFELELGKLRDRFAGAPRAELICLFLLALEREEIVSVAYREQVIGERLSRMDLGDDVRELISHALLWAWKDEEMHAIYIRGAIFRDGNFRLRTSAYMHQAAGAVGGWAASVRQHARWRDAPFARLVATMVTFAGKVAGKVPREVGKGLDYGPFRAFCVANIDAERTAARCWSRIFELASNDGSMPASLLRDFQRIVDDELRHQRIFEIFAGALTDDDRLADGESASTLAAKIAEVGEAFLPRRMRPRGDAQPLGSGAPVFVRSGADTRRMLRELLDEVQPQGRRVAIKPTFMLGYSTRDRSLITDPGLVDELARALRERGAEDVAVIEGPNIYDHFYAHRSVREVAEYLGYRSDHYRVVDASEEQEAHRYTRGLAQSTVARTWRDADLRISFPKMRSHPIELAYLSVANVEWLGGRCDEFLFCERQAQRYTAVMMLLDDFPPQLAIIDAGDSAADGLFGAMGCTHPKAPHRLYAGRDALAVDLTAARHMGVARPHYGSILRAAQDWFGAAAPPRVDGIDTPIAGWRGPYDNEVWAFLSAMAYPVYVIGSARGSMFLPEMDERAFPPLAPAGVLTRIGRGATRRLLGLHHRA
ncbi:MAG: hypothetical protein QOE68_2504 [Thermoanaerobaculia bacterium]|nr:hypothetical protein [Thermoanaerobaculia bacterium]